MTRVARVAAGLRQAQTPRGESRRILGMGMTWIRIRLILTSKEVLSVKREDLLFLFMQGFTLPSSINPRSSSARLAFQEPLLLCRVPPCRVTNNPNPFLSLRRGFDLHPKPLCPLQGRGLTAPPVALTLMYPRPITGSGFIFYRLAH